MTYKEIRPLVPSGYVNGFAVNDQGDNAFLGANRVITISVQGTGTVVVHGSIQKSIVDFSQPSSPTNMHAQVAVYDYALTSNQIVSSIVVNNSTKIVEVNANFLMWFAIERTVGTPNVIITVTDNQ